MCLSGQLISDDRTSKEADKVEAFETDSGAKELFVEQFDIYWKEAKRNCEIFRNLLPISRAIVEKGSAGRNSC